MLPPTRPIEASCKSCFPESFLIAESSLSRIMMEKRKTATAAFFRNVNANGLKPWTAKLLAKMLMPLTTAVKSTRRKPFLSFIAKDCC